MTLLQASLTPRHWLSTATAASKPAVRRSTGNWREEHLFVLHQLLGMYDDIARHLAECDTKLLAELATLGQKNVYLGKPSCFGSKQRKDYDEH